MFNRIANIIHDCHLQGERLLVLGISGGPDSLYLMHALHGLGCLMVAVHVNHRLRPESDQEEVKVKQFADHLGITLRICRVDVMTYAKEESLFLGRSWSYS